MRLAEWVDPTTALLLGTLIGGSVAFVLGVCVGASIHDGPDDPSFLDTES